MKIFVYGTLKRGCCRAHVLQDQTFLGTARTSPHYRMYNTGSFPALIADPQGRPIEGEVWEVDGECLRVLDAIEGVPQLYRREAITLEPPDRDVVETYVYQPSVDGLEDCGTTWCEGDSPAA